MAKDCKTKKRKFILGRPIVSLDELMNQEFIYWRGFKLTHVGWFSSWPIRLCQQYISKGYLWKAAEVENKEASDAKTFDLLKDPSFF